MDAWRRENGARSDGGRFAKVCVIRRPDASSCEKYHNRQWSANFSRSLLATPNGVVERFRAEGGSVDRAFLGVLDLPENDAEDGDTNPDLIPGLVAGGDTDVAEGRS